MAKSDRSYEIGRHDRDWIESVAEPIHPVLAEIEDAALPERIPILDRESGRVLALLASGRRRICEVGTAYGYTCWFDRSFLENGYAGAERIRPDE